MFFSAPALPHWPTEVCGANLCEPARCKARAQGNETVVFLRGWRQEAKTLASISAPLSSPLPSSPVFVVFVRLCADLGVRNAVATTGSLDRFHLSLVSLPLLVSACTSHLGARPCVTIASLRSVLCLGVLSTPCFLCLLLVSYCLCCLFSLTFIVCISS